MREPEPTEAPESTEAPLLTRDVARLIERSSERVRQLARENRLKAIRSAGGVRLYDRASIEKYLRSRE